MDVGSVDRVCVGVGGPIDFLAHVKAAREEPPPTTYNLRQPLSTSRDYSPSLLSFPFLLLRTFRSHRLCSLRARVRCAARDCIAG